MTIWMVISHDHPDGQELEFLEGPDGQKNRICSDHPDGQALEFLEGLDGQELECS